VLLNDAAGNERVPVKPARKTGNTHPVIDPQLQRLHALTLVRVMLLPVCRVRVGRQAADARQCVINVPAAVGVQQCRIAR